jgi:hypothetical protein
MGNDNSPSNGKSKNEAVAEQKLRGDAMTGSERNAAADHAEYEKTRNPDTELHLDGEEDALYSDGLDIKEDTGTLSGTRGTSPGTIKP